MSIYQKVGGLILGQSTYQGFGFDPYLGCVEGGWSVFLALFPSLSKIKTLRKTSQLIIQQVFIKCSLNT